MNKSLIDSLRQGGYIFFSRHGEATIGNDLPNLYFQNCLTQRNLSETGRMQAIYYGQILRFLQIPVNFPVSASPFCRTIETAQLAFGSENVHVDPFWLNVYGLNENLPSGERQRILNRLQKALELKPQAGQNNIIIAHSFPKGQGLGEIPYMGTVIIKPNGVGNGFEIINRFSLSDLRELGS
ncbi:MAG TPA: histidine phosphatase family protein [Ureibacillus sp.]|nr:histidine phosphatase family protein [Ureibacillus sp.]